MNEWNNLALAIVEQAIEDYRSVLLDKPIYDVLKTKCEGGVIVRKTHSELMKDRRNSCKKSIHELETFFRSQYFASLVDVDGETIIKRIREECDMRRKARFRE